MFSPLEHYNTLGYIIVGITILGVYLVYPVSTLVKKKAAEQINQKAGAVFTNEADVKV